MARKLISITSIFGVILLIAIQLSIRFEHKHVAYAADPAAYTYLSHITNIYTAFSLVYDLTFLDADTQYTFSLYTTDYTTGTTKVKLLQQKSISGVTSATLEFDNVHAATYYPATVEEETAPLIVVDQWNNIIGHHFVTPAPNDAWWEADTSTAVYYKTAIGDVIYNDKGLYGYQHDPYNIAASTTQIDGITLLHYQAPAPGGYAVSTDQEITITDLANPITSTVISLDDLVHYNCGNSGIADSYWILAHLDYVVLNTTGNPMPYIDTIQELLSFPDTSYHQDPFKTSFSPGVYEYVHTDATAHELSGIGESVWILENTSTPIPEWSIDLPDEVIENKLARLTLTAVDSNVWAGYDYSLLYDYTLGAISDPATYAAKQTVSFTVGSEASNNNIWYIRQPTAWYLSTAPEAYFRFLVSDTYDIIVQPPIGIMAWFTTYLNSSSKPADEIKLLLLLGILAGGGLILNVVFNVKAKEVYTSFAILVILGFILMARPSIWVDVPLLIISGLLLYTSFKTHSTPTDSNIE